jgi:mannose-1-phosphate guanylyltransferase
MFIVIMAGGSGTRFWPASRERLPKQFLKITGNRTMLEETLNRAGQVSADPSATYIVVNRLHRELTEDLTRGTGYQVLAEPVGRNTAACIGLAAMHIGRVDPDEPILVLPSDHFIGQPGEFAAVLRAAGEAARSRAIVTIGATPTRPETGYGYVELGEEAGAAGGRRCFQVKRFVEKPDIETAGRYLSSGGFLWNCGIFGFTARTMLDEIRACKPELFAGLERIGGAIGTPGYEAVLAEVYPTLESISIDYAVIEKTRIPLLVFPGDFGWSDVGSWQALYELDAGSYDEARNQVSGDVAAIDSIGNLVHSTGGRLVTLLGVEGLVVIDTADALLVARLDRSQDVKQIQELLRRKKRDDLC